MAYPINAPVSIIIPVFNGMPFLPETIESVRRQTYPDWELIIVDNKSTDHTADYIDRELKERPDARIRFVSSDSHLPMVPNWNRALEYATHPLIKILPSDDILMPDCLEIQVRLLQENSDVGFVTSGKELIDGKGRRLFTKNVLKQGIYDWDAIGLRSVCDISNHLGEPGGILFRAELLKSCGAYDPELKYFLDVDLLLRFLRKSKVLVWGKPLYQFRIHGQSASAASRRLAVVEYFHWLSRFEKELRLAKRPWFRRYLHLKASVIPYLRSLIFSAVEWRLRSGT
jgi:glycosyltransferase involved in cell wall biosynthesis